MKKILSLLTASILFLGIGFTQVANAEWQSTSRGWQYNQNGTTQTRWLKDNNQWYYLGYDGIMKTGWVYDVGTWYYLMDHGVLNDSLTTKTMPTEIKGIYDTIRFYAPKAKLLYNGLVPPTGYMTQLFTDEGFANKTIYSFTEFDDYGNTMSEYYYSPYNGCVYHLTQTGVERLGVGDTTIAKKTFSKEQAIQNVKNYVTNNHKNMPANFEVLSDTDETNTNTYIVHFYNLDGEKLSNHASATNGWYYVDKTYGSVISMYDL